MCSSSTSSPCLSSREALQPKKEVEDCQYALNMRPDRECNYEQKNQREGGKVQTFL